MNTLPSENLWNILSQPLKVHGIVQTLGKLRLFSEVDHLSGKPH